LAQLVEHFFWGAAMWASNPLAQKKRRNAARGGCEL
jgi:hypothetical protein